LNFLSCGMLILQKIACHNGKICRKLFWSPPSFIWSFIVPSNPRLVVPSSPTVPTHTFTLITSKLKEIDQFNVQQRERKLNFLSNGLSRFFILQTYVTVFLSLKISFFRTKKLKNTFHPLQPKLINMF